MEQFIREKIKDKPLNKKRLAKKAGTAALCGVAFAVAASIVFAIFLPVINRQSKKASQAPSSHPVLHQNLHPTPKTWKILYPALQDIQPL